LEEFVGYSEFTHKGYTRVRGRGVKMRYRSRFVEVVSMQRIVIAS
jgi:hypothetical protein